MANIKDFIVKNGMQVLGVGSAASTSTGTGALVVGGGLGVNGDIHAKNMYSNGAQVITTASLDIFDGIVQSITPGTDISVNTSTGAVTVNNTSTLQTVTGRGASTDVALSFTNATAATDTTSGALKVAGGVGVVGAVYAGSLHDNGSRVITSVDATPGTGISITAETTSGPSAGFTINNIGVISVTSGTETTVSASTGSNVSVNVTSTLQNVTDRGASSTNAISITNATAATSTATGALTVAGGVGIGGNLYVAGEIVADKLTIQYTTVTTTLIQTDDIIQTLNTTAATNTASGALRVAGGAGIGGAVYAGSVYDNGSRVITSVDATPGTGISITAETTSGPSAGFTINNTGVVSLEGSTFLGVNTSTGNVTLTNLGVQSLSSGTETTVSASTGSNVAVNVTSTLQNVTDRGASSTNAISISNTSSSTSTIAGNALQVTGGAGFGSVFVEGSLVVNGAQVVTTANAGVTRIEQGTGIAVSASTGSVTITNIGVTSINSGTDITVTASTGSVTVNNASTLQTVTGRGASSTNAIDITNSTASTGTTSGALKVAGGVGIGGAINVGTTANIGTAAQLLSFSSASVNTAAPITLDSYLASEYRTAKYVVQVVDGTNVQVEELLVFHNTTDAFIIKYGIGTSNGELGDWDATLSGGSISLTFTPNYNPTALTVKTVRTTVAA